MARKSRQPQQQGILPASPSNENTATVYRTGIYARLSDKNFSSTDVDVLGNQLNHLRDYVANHDDMELVDTYVDDGWRGSSFNRPDFNRMMADVKSGRINCILVAIIWKWVITSTKSFLPTICGLSPYLMILTVWYQMQTPCCSP